MPSKRFWLVFPLFRFIFLNFYYVVSRMKPLLLECYIEEYLVRTSITLSVIILFSLVVLSFLSFLNLAKIIITYLPYFNSHINTKQLWVPLGHRCALLVSVGYLWFLKSIPSISEPFKMWFTFCWFSISLCIRES